MELNNLNFFGQNYNFIDIAGGGWRYSNVTVSEQSEHRGVWLNYGNRLTSFYKFPNFIEADLFNMHLMEHPSSTPQIYNSHIYRTDTDESYDVIYTNHNHGGGNYRYVRYNTTVTFNFPQPIYYPCSYVPQLDVFRITAQGFSLSDNRYGEPNNTFTGAICTLYNPQTWDKRHSWFNGTIEFCLFNNFNSVYQYVAKVTDYSLYFPAGNILYTWTNNQGFVNGYATQIRYKANSLLSKTFEPLIAIP